MAPHWLIVACPSMVAAVGVKLPLLVPYSDFLALLHDMLQVIVSHDLPVLTMECESDVVWPAGWRSKYLSLSQKRDRS